MDTEHGPRGAGVRVLPTISEVIQAFPEAIVAVDMPIGLVSGTGGRGCDTAARAALGARRSSVFAPPCRAALVCADYAQANRVNREHTGKGLSKQSWMIAPKMRELDAAVTPTLQERLIESHPEVAFAVAAGAPMTAHKATFHGLFERLALLHRLGFDPAALATTVAPGTRAAPDDLLDACILAHVAQKRGYGRARVFPDVPRRDERGLRMEIWA